MCCISVIFNLCRTAQPQLKSWRQHQTGWIPISDPLKIFHPIPSHDPRYCYIPVSPIYLLTFIFVLPLNLAYHSAQQKNNKNSCKSWRGLNTFGPHDLHCKVGGDSSDGSHMAVAPMACVFNIYLYLKQQQLTSNKLSACCHNHALC